MKDRGAQKKVEEELHSQRTGEAFEGTMTFLQVFLSEVVVNSRKF